MGLLPHQHTPTPTYTHTPPAPAVHGQRLRRLPGQRRRLQALPAGHRAERGALRRGECSCCRALNALWRGCGGLQAAQCSAAPQGLLVARQPRSSQAAQPAVRPPPPRACGLQCAIGCGFGSGGACNARGQCTKCDSYFGLVGGACKDVSARVWGAAGPLPGRPPHICSNNIQSGQRDADCWVCPLPLPWQQPWIVPAPGGWG